MPDSSPDSMSLAITWDDILKPGKATGDVHRIDPFSALPVLVPNPQDFSLANACFLAAHSLLIYRSYSNRSAPEDGPTFPGRREILERLGLKETFTGEIAGTTCSILEPLKPVSPTGPATIVFRGTSHFKNWLTNIQSLPKAWAGGGHVHGGFAAAHEEIWDQLGPRIELIARAGRPIFITGHSLGGALATLSLSEIAQLYGTSAACAYTFGSPRVGNEVFASSTEGAHHFRFVNSMDVVTRLPLPFALSRRLSYLHAGDACFIDEAGTVHQRGSGDLAEEAVSLSQFKNLVRHTTDSFRKIRPPDFLADHAPARYLEKIRRAHLASGGRYPQSV